jgi:hypothetical protein
MIGAIDDLPSIELDDVDATAALQTRVDRKYVVDAVALGRLVSTTDDVSRVLQIGGRRTFAYESTYFDTPDHWSYLAAAHGRPARCKIRTRTYLDTESCWSEVKLHTRQGTTVKHRWSHDISRRQQLTPASLEFISTFDIIRPHAALLEPMLTTRFDRTTLLCGHQRVTIDTGLTCTDRNGSVTGIGDRIIIETKSPGAAGIADRALWAAGARPTAFSKFAIGTAGLDPNLPSNKWHRTITRHLVREH